MSDNYEKKICNKPLDKEQTDDLLNILNKSQGETDWTEDELLASYESEKDVDGFWAELNYRTGVLNMRDADEFRIIPSEVKIIVPEKNSAKNEAAAAKKLAGITLRPQASREDMIEVIKKEYRGAYLDRILNNLDGNPQKQDYNGIISCLRKLFPSTYDFREAKRLLALDNMNKVELCYTRICLRNMWEKKREEDKENWKQSILDEYGSWQEYFKACGWIEHKGSYYKPEVVKKTTEPDVFQQFNVVSYRHENRKGYRGKKSEAREKAVQEERM